MQAEANRVALVAGANGMVGMALVRALLDSGDYSRVIALTRRPLPLDAPRLVNRTLRFAALETEMKGLACHDAYCCLGTTLKDAGSPQAFRAIDHDLIVSFARGAQAAGAQTLVVVSSVGANPGSRNFYLRVKGETEAALEALRFKSLHLLQPLLLGGYARFRAIDAKVVAAAMRAAARSGRVGVLRHTYAGIQSLARTGKVAPRV
jgi:uncharacterized protein YbjT (DUF2867 family)